MKIADTRSRESLAQYISRPPVSLKKIRYEPFKRRVLFHRTYSQYFKENTHLFEALDFLAEAHVTKPYTASSSSSRRELHSIVPSRRVQLIRRYGLYASRTKGRWDQMEYVATRAPEGWRASHQLEASDPEGPGFEALDDGEEIDVNAGKRAWALLLAKVHEIDPLVCPKCGGEEIRDILAHLVKTGRVRSGHEVRVRARFSAASCLAGE